MHEPSVATGGRAYFDLIFAASSARFFCQASYSGVPRRGGTSFGSPPSQLGTLSATTPLTAGRGSVAQAGSIMQAMAAKPAKLGFMVATTCPNHVQNMTEARQREPAPSPAGLAALVLRSDREGRLG